MINNAIVQSLFHNSTSFIESEVILSIPSCNQWKQF